MIILSLIASASIAGLRPGATVRLPPGPHPRLVISGERYDPPVVIDMTGARVAGLQLTNTEGVVLRGGTVEAPEGFSNKASLGNGLTGQQMKNVVIEKVHFTNATRAMVIGNSHGITVRGSRFSGLRSDGINMAGVTNVLIEDNVMEDFLPIKPKGTRGQPDFVDGDHPDAIQIWTTKITPFGRDIMIRRNTIRGDMQGINFFGPKGEGYERVRILDNSVQVRFPAAIGVFFCTNCEVIGNEAWSWPGNNHRANILVRDSTGNFCGNRMRDMPENKTVRRC